MSVSRIYWWCGGRIGKGLTPCLRAASIGMAVVAASMVAGPADGVAPKIWEENSREAFDSGEAEGVSLNHDGTVTLAPAIRQAAETGAGFVWSILPGPGKEVTVGTGSPAAIFRVSGAGLPDKVAEIEEVAVFSLARGKSGDLFAGSSPGGLIYRIADGQDPEPFCRTGDSHVWALLPSPSGGLYAATGGETGRVLSISKGGKARVLYASSDPNVVSLAVSKDGTLYAGTDENGWVYRIRSSGDVQVLYDANEKEVHSLAVGENGLVYAGAMTGKPKGKGGSPPPGGSKDEHKRTSAVYAIRPTGSAIRLWETDAGTLLGLSVDPSGELTALTGTPGRIYRIRPDGGATLTLAMKDVTPWSFAPDGSGGYWMGTSGGGEVYRVDSSRGESGTLTSAAHDFALVSTWGKLSWSADLPSGTSVAFQTRSGNSEEPDDTWSPWAGPLRDRDGSAIPSPPARFLQYRAQLKSRDGRRTPRLRTVSLAGLQENVAPTVLSVESDHNVHANGMKGTESPNEVWLIRWEAGDVNDDRLTYTLHYKGVAETVWKPLTEDLNTNQYEWNTETVPDGLIQVRVTASDKASNPIGEMQTAQKVSTPFSVDNTGPVVELSGSEHPGPRSVRVEGRVTDGTSAVREASYAMDSGDWQVVFPVDGIFDSLDERLSIALSDVVPGEHVLVVKAMDMLGNVGVSKRVFTVD